MIEKYLKCPKCDNKVKYVHPAQNSFCVKCYEVMKEIEVTKYVPNYECPECLSTYEVEVGEKPICCICGVDLHPYNTDPSLPPEGSISIPESFIVRSEPSAMQLPNESQDVSPEFSNYHEKKWDEGKLELSLIPWKGVEAVGEVAMYGLAKGYKKDSWKEVPNGLQRYKEALIRHLVADLKGEAIDKESGLFHLYHAAWNALAICHFIKEDIGG